MEKEQLSELYKIRFDKNFLSRKNEIWKVLCRDFFQKFIPDESTVIDLACGYGEFINNISAKNKVAFDLNNETRTFLNKDILFYERSVMELSKHCENTADIIFTSNFLEHLENKDMLEKLLQEIYQSLKKGGKYLIIGPNLKYLNGAYWDFYDHHLGLTHISLQEALRLNGFKVDLCYRKFLPFSMQGSLPTHPLLVKFYLKFSPAWLLLGKQFFIIASK